MRSTPFVVIGVVGIFGLVVAAPRAQQGGRAGAPAQQAAPVPNAPVGKTAFWSAEDIDARWREDETLKRANSRLFNAPTNISANVRIVLPNDPPLVHATTSDLWIVTRGTAVARTDGQTVDGPNGTKMIRNGMQRNVAVGDILYVPPGVPHHFTDLNNFRAWLMRFDTLGLERTGPAPAAARGEGAAPAAGRGAAAAPAGRGAAAPAPPVPNLSLDKTMFWPHSDLVARWKDNEANKRINSRLYNGPANISANVRIVLPNDPPLVHEGTADLWLVTEGTAVARTDGKMVGTGDKATIQGATARPVKPGDLLYVPPGVPHHFTDLKGFRALLIRYDVEGWKNTRADAGR